MYIKKAVSWYFTHILPPITVMGTLNTFILPNDLGDNTFAMYFYNEDTATRDSELLIQQFMLTCSEYLLSMHLKDHPLQMPVKLQPYRRPFSLTIDLQVNLLQQLWPNLELFYYHSRGNVPLVTSRWNGKLIS